MDMSKLPRMSQTPPPPPPEPSDAAAADDEGRATHGVAAGHSQSTYRQEVGYATEPPPSFAEGWISIAIGLILLFVFPNFWQWLISKVSSYKPPFLPITDMNTGAEIPYTQSIFFFGHLCVFAFALVLIIDGLILFTRRPALLMFAFAFTVISTAMNFFHVANETMQGRGFPLVSALAFAFGVYIAIFQWKLLQAHRFAIAARR
jgi:uncharacterized protein YjeT (DUF2065 family)